MQEGFSEQIWHCTNELSEDTTRNDADRNKIILTLAGPNTEAWTLLTSLPKSLCQLVTGCDLHETSNGDIDVQELQLIGVLMVEPNTEDDPVEGQPNTAVSFD